MVDICPYKTPVVERRLDDDVFYEDINQVNTVPSFKSDHPGFTCNLNIKYLESQTRCTLFFKRKKYILRWPDTIYLRVGYIFESRALACYTNAFVSADAQIAE